MRRQRLMAPTWSDNEIETLTTLWNNGKSAAQIGIVVKRSREAVLGKIHRLKLPYNGTKKRPVTHGPEELPIEATKQAPSPPRKFSWELDSE